MRHDRAAAAASTAAPPVQSGPKRRKPNRHSSVLTNKPVDVPPMPTGKELQACSLRFRYRRVFSSYLSQEIADAASNVVRSSPALQKFWNRRHLYFSRFSGNSSNSDSFPFSSASPHSRVFSDVAGYFMVTPEEISAHHAAACTSSIVIDATAGIGGVTVHLGRTCSHVIAVEMDAVRAAIVAHNCNAYGVAQYVDVILGDFLCVSSRFKADVVLITPPYGHMSLPQSANLTETPFELQSAALGGKSYASTGSFDLSLLPVDISKFVSVARRIAPSQVLVLPRSSITPQPAI